MSNKKDQPLVDKTPKSSQIAEILLLMREGSENLSIPLKADDRISLVESALYRAPSTSSAQVTTQPTVRTNINYYIILLF